MIVITGAAGFIGSCLITRLNAEGHFDLLLVDDFAKEEKKKNYSDKKFSLLIPRTEFLDWFRQNSTQVSFVFHIGARTDTTEFNKAIFDELNVNYSKAIWNICTERNIPMVYASSAATYGLGEYGYDDEESKIGQLKPLNPYGDSKNDFDKWVLIQKKCPPQWQGLKFFNVYGPNEYHKGRMASVVFHGFNQAKTKGEIKLFRSHKVEYKDGGQLRDFVYVKDLIDVLFFLFKNKINNGIYNLGSGKARTFEDLATCTLKALDLPVKIEFIDTPADIRDKYQYFTEAIMNKLIAQGYQKPFTSLEDGIEDYVKNYLIPNKYF